GWREATTPYGKDGSSLSVADITDPESLAQVRVTKKAMKAKAKARAAAGA
ncbi:MAG: Fe-S cluster assembly protein HesB, partial [Polyangiaceae bacterium]